MKLKIGALVVFSVIACIALAKHSTRVEEVREHRFTPKYIGPQANIQLPDGSHTVLPAATLAHFIQDAASVAARTNGRTVECIDEHMINACSDLIGDSFSGSEGMSIDLIVTTHAPLNASDELHAAVRASPIVQCALLAAFTYDVVAVEGSSSPRLTQGTFTEEKVREAQSIPNLKTVPVRTIVDGVSSTWPLTGHGMYLKRHPEAFVIGAEDMHLHRIAGNLYLLGMITKDEAALSAIDRLAITTTWLRTEVAVAKVLSALRVRQKHGKTGNAALIMHERHQQSFEVLAKYLRLKTRIHQTVLAGM